MKFYHFLNENRTESITEEQFKTLLNKHCSDILNRYPNVNTIYRGMKSSIEYGFIDPTKFTRMSAYAQFNYYTLLMDEILPSWSNMPKRSKSIICSSSIGRAKDYGNTYIVYPYNTSRIAVSPESDIWDTFVYLPVHPLDNLNDFIDDVVSFFKISGSDNKKILETFKIMNRLKEYMNDDEKKLLNYNDFSYVFNDFKKSNHKDFLTYLNELMRPTKNNIKLYYPKNYTSKDDNEIWIEGPCLLQETSVFDSFKDLKQ